MPKYIKITFVEKVCALATLAFSHFLKHPGQPPSIGF